MEDTLFSNYCYLYIWCLGGHKILEKFSSSININNGRTYFLSHIVDYGYLFPIEALVFFSGLILLALHYLSFPLIQIWCLGDHKIVENFFATTIFSHIVENVYICPTDCMSSSWLIIFPDVVLSFSCYSDSAPWGSKNSIKCLYLHKYE